MKTLHLTNLLIASITIAIVLLSTHAMALTVQSVRFGHYPDKTRLVIDLNQNTEFRSFVLADPYRMVIDLPSFTWKNAGIENQQQSGISAVRHGNLKPGISRIVFDFNRPIAIQDAFSLPANAGKPPRLVIDFADTSASGFKSAQNKIWGKLNTDKTPQIAAAPPPKQNTSKPDNKKPLVIIDPGHGGVDPGAIAANGLQEKKIVLALSKELKKQLEASGKYRVKMTRYDDTFVKLSNRVKYARKHQGDLFISIHADSLRNNNKVSGASFYTLSEKASDAEAAKLAARENKADLIAGIELEVEDDAVMDILLDLSRRNTQNQSKYFSNILVNNFKSNQIKLLTNPNRHANFAVLKAQDIPSVLVETGFISNKGEAQKLNTPQHRKRIAQTLKKGIDAYFKTVKENERS